MRYSQKHLKSYGSRDEALLKFGFKSYMAYLASDMWRKKRRGVYSRQGAKCLACGATGKDAKLVIHHRVYSEDVLFGSCYDWMVVLCGVCHEKIEITEKGKKRKYDEVDDALLQLCPSLQKIQQNQRQSRKPQMHPDRLTKAERKRLRAERKAARKAAKEAAKARKHAIPAEKRKEIIANLLANPRF